MSGKRKDVRCKLHTELERCSEPEKGSTQRHMSVVERILWCCRKVRSIRESEARVWGREGVNV